MKMIFNASKILYSEIAPHFSRIHNMLIESLLMIHVACEQCTSPLQLDHIISSYSAVSLLVFQALQVIKGLHC